MTEPIAPDALREAVARAIDPPAFHTHWSEARDPRDREHGERRKVDAYRAADAVLAVVAKHRDAEVERLESIEFIHAGCKGIHDRDVQTVLDQRDRIVAYLAGTEWEHPINQILTGTDR